MCTCTNTAQYHDDINGDIIHTDLISNSKLNAPPTSKIYQNAGGLNYAVILIHRDFLKPGIDIGPDVYTTLRPAVD